MAEVIRKAEPRDHEAVAAIYNESIDSGGATMDRTRKSAADIAGWIAEFNDRERLMVSDDAGRIVAWGIIKRYSDREGYRYACETATYVAASELRKGYGSRLKVEVIRICRELGYHHMVAKIFASNVASIEYNRRLGYEIVGRQREIGYFDGRWLDVVIMQRVLDDVVPEETGENG